MMVIVIIGIVSALAIVAFTNELPTLRADSALQLLEAQIRQAREAAVDQRRSILVTFQGTGEMVTVRQNLNVTTTPPTVISTTTLGDFILDPNQMVFNVFNGLPDTPDAFGNSQPVSFTDTTTSAQACPNLPCTITFQGDGSVVDNAGNYVNGTVFIGSVGSKITARAVTILGSTGRIKGYRYKTNAWF
jgi:type II secretory pathway pseudopilin PulG